MEFIFKVEHLCFSYKEKKIFDDFNISFPVGECSAIMASSGYGKTTLLYLIAGLLPVLKGNIIYPVKNPSFSFVFQENRLINQISIASNLHMVNSKLTNAEICKYLLQVGLNSDYLYNIPCQLSGGEQRRVAILRALIAEYDILLLDEPFTGLDYTSKNMMMDYIKDNTKGKTVLLVTHQKEEASYLGGKNIFKL